MAFQIEKILRENGYPDRAKRMGICANTCVAYKSSASGSIFFKGLSCKDRVCPICNAIRAGRLARRVEKNIEKMDNPHQMEITLGRQKDLQQAVDSFYYGVRRLKKTVWWARYIKGGMSFVEVTYNQNGWHVHLHTVVDVLSSGNISNITDFDGRLIKISSAKLELEETLLKVGLGCISHIQSCNVESSREVSKYLAKFVGKLEESALLEFITVFYRRRIVSSFGSFYGVVSDEIIDKEENDTLVPLGSISENIEMFVNGDLQNEVVRKALLQGFISEIRC